MLPKTGGLGPRDQEHRSEIMVNGNQMPGAGERGLGEDTGPVGTMPQSHPYSGYTKGPESYWILTS